MKFKNKKRIIKFKYLAIETLQIVVGTAIMAFGTCLFLLPNQLSAGGFSGLGTITYYLFGIPLGTTTIILNIPLFIMSFIKNGKKFFVNALLGTVLLSIFFNIFEGVKPLTTDRFLACIYGGIIIGIGTAIILKCSSSTGGTDLLIQIIKAFNPGIRISSLLVLLDILIVLFNVIFFKQLEIGLYSAITIYIMGKMLDIFFEGINFGRIIYIVSLKYEDIAKEIGNEVRRGSTALKAKGMYKNEEKNVIMCVVSRNEVIEIRKIVNKIDKNAFVVITNAREVFGEGFREE